MHCSMANSNLSSTRAAPAPVAMATISGSPGTPRAPQNSSSAAASMVKVLLQSFPVISTAEALRDGLRLRVRERYAIAEIEVGPRLGSWGGCLVGPEWTQRATRSFVSVRSR